MGLIGKAQLVGSVIIIMEDQELVGLKNRALSWGRFNRKTLKIEILWKEPLLFSLNQYEKTQTTV